MTNIIIGLLDFLAFLLNKFLPNFSSGGTSEISNAITYFVQMISLANYLIPVNTIFTVTGLWVGYKLIMLGVWFANWIIRTVRG
ncbi:MAG: hypothetical protein ACLRSF_15065 [Romboutsia timonensis]|uniref:hypothetical protein n=1 Tax=Romboutsia timonensis TaxID=1776391 RepID=UPI00399090F6